MGNPTSRKKRGSATAPDKARPGVAALDGSPPSSPPLLAAAPVAALPVPTRSESGTFLPGKSGNPAGKPKGVRNYITQKRLELEAALCDYLIKPANRRKAERAIDRLFTVIDTGEDREAVSAVKVLFGNVIIAAKQAEEQEKVRKTVTVIIDNRIPDRAGPPVRPAVTIEDAEYTVES